MKRFLGATLLLFLLMSPTAFADSILIHLFPNNGTGDNFGFVERTGGLFIQAHGGTPYDLFNDQLGFEPGSQLGGGFTLFISETSVTFGGNTYDVGFFPGTLSLIVPTFPTNGTGLFIAPADISFFASGINFTTGEPFDVSGHARGHITFFLSDGLYYANDAGFVQAPEPGTLGLFGTGLMGIVALARKRFLSRLVSRGRVSSGYCD